MPEAIESHRRAAGILAVVALSRGLLGWAGVADDGAIQGPVTTSRAPSTARVTTSPAPTGSSAETAALWTTYHRDLQRTAAEPGPTAKGLNRAWTSDPLDGEIYSEPLVVGDRAV